MKVITYTAVVDGDGTYRTRDLDRAIEENGLTVLDSSTSEVELPEESSRKG